MILPYVVEIACLTIPGSFARTVYEAVPRRLGRVEGVSYAVFSLTVPLFAVGFLYEYGSISAETSNLTAFGRVVVAATIPLPALALVSPPDPFTLIRRVDLALIVATPVVYLFLFRMLGFDIAYDPDGV